MCLDIDKVLDRPKGTDTYVGIGINRPVQFVVKAPTRLVIVAGWFVVGVLHPGNSYGHIRMGSDL